MPTLCVISIILSEEMKPIVDRFSFSFAHELVATRNSNEVENTLRDDKTFIVLLLLAVNNILVSEFGLLVIIDNRVNPRTAATEGQPEGVWIGVSSGT